ncbi:MAG TPA: arylesterase, partial [Gemmatimonadota bacterium]|nr:arylesterase [Gemmatimonadota bacterium]
ALICALAVACGRGGAEAGNVRPDAGEAAVRAPGDSAEPPGRDRASGASGSAAAAGDSTPVVLFLGNSLTAGLGLGPDRAYPALIQARIDSAGLPFRAVNAGVSGATSADGVRQVGAWMDLPVAVLVLELGANDMLRGQDLAATRRNLQAIIDTVRARRPAARVVIAGMRAPPNLGSDYAERFRAIFPAVARANGAALVPFLLEGVAADPDLNQEDGMHPNAAGERILAANVWRVLEGVLREVAGGRGPAARRASPSRPASAAPGGLRPAPVAFAGPRRSSAVLSRSQPPSTSSANAASSAPFEAR